VAQVSRPSSPRAPAITTGGEPKHQTRQARKAVDPPPSPSQAHPRRRDPLCREVAASAMRGGCATAVLSPHLRFLPSRMRPACTAAAELAAPGRQGPMPQPRTPPAPHHVSGPAAQGIGSSQLAVSGSKTLQTGFIRQRVQMPQVQSMQHLEVEASEMVHCSGTGELVVA
jgi:hypothetical protein